MRDERSLNPANQTSSILCHIDVVLIGISWIIGLTSGTDVGPMSEKHIGLTSEADFGPMSDKPLSDEFDARVICKSRGPIICDSE